MKSLVIGASAGLGRALSEALSRRGSDLTLVASQEADLQALANDLRIRFGNKIENVVWDLNHSVPAQLSSGIWDHVFVVAGASMPARDPMELSKAEVSTLIDVNFRAPALLIHSLLPTLVKSGSQNLVLIGTVAAARARGKNLIYASSKTALEFFGKGLQFALCKTTVRVQIYRCGFLRTQMTFGQSGPIPYSDPAVIASQIIDKLGRDRFEYLPGWWRWITLIFSLIPAFILKKGIR
jgi:short-subunit dehydrogenase